MKHVFEISLEFEPNRSDCKVLLIILTGLSGQNTAPQKHYDYLPHDRVSGVR